MVKFVSVGLCFAYKRIFLISRSSCQEDEKITSFDGKEDYRDVFPGEVPREKFQGGKQKKLRERK